MKPFSFNIITALLFVASAVGAETLTAETHSDTNAHLTYSYSGQKISLGNKCDSKKVSTLKKNTKQSFRKGPPFFNHYLFTFTNEMEEINIYDIDENYSKIATIKLEKNKLYHCNNVNFGNEYATPGDPFPLLYVSMENAKEHKCVVLQMSVSEKVWGAKVVQIITYPAPSEFGYYPNCYIDKENSRILVGAYQNSDWKTSANDNGLKWACWDLPKLNEGNLSLSLNKALYQFNTPFKTASQGGQIEYGKLYQAYGIPGTSRQNSRWTWIFPQKTLSPC